MEKNPLTSQAEALSRKLERERAGRNLMLGKVVKTQNTTQVILKADPELQAAFVERVVGVHAKLGTPKGKKITEWFRGNAVPYASAEVVRLLLRRELPFTDPALAGMFERLSRLTFLSLVCFNEQLAQAFEKYAKKNALSAALRKAVARYADAIAIRRLPQGKAKFWKEEWGFPRAVDRKIAGRLDRILSR
jgi:hypothetical protein